MPYQSAALFRAFVRTALLMMSLTMPATMLSNMLLNLLVVFMLLVLVPRPINAVAHIADSPC